MEQNWKCPYCGHAQVLTERNYEADFIRHANDRSKHGKLCFVIRTKVCANSDCQGLCLQLDHFAVKEDALGRPSTGHLIRAFKLMPESSAKPLPTYIPKPIAENYRQACRIRDLSPNASATMARRCLQGMIRNFCGIEKNNLYQEIEELKKQVEEGKAPQGVAADVVDHIHAVREKGNIGAHMEGDINLMVDVEPEEAQILIELLELLFDEWYIARAKREERLAKAKDLLRPAEPENEQVVGALGAVRVPHEDG